MLPHPRGDLHDSDQVTEEAAKPMVTFMKPVWAFFFLVDENTNQQHLPFRHMIRKVPAVVQLGHSLGHASWATKTLVPALPNTIIPPAAAYTVDKGQLGATDSCW